jgi:hypothetical protein
MRFTTATTLDEALAALADGARPVAGGSDLVVGARQGKAPLPEHLVAIEALDHHVVAEHVLQRIRLRHRLHVGEIERIHIGEVGQHAVELFGGPVELGGGELEAGQPGDLGHIGGGDPFRHER